MQNYSSKQKMKGQVTFGIASLFSVGTLVASVFGAYYTTQQATAEKISDVKLESAREITMVRGEVNVVSSRVDNQEKRADRFEAKLDTLLEKNNINPAIINARFREQTFSSTSASRIE